MNNKKQVRPIRFSKLEVGSKYQTFAEPSRDIRKSNDPTVWIKTAEAWSTDTTNEERIQILYPEDLVLPLSRPQQQRGN
jgi:hypothetical protein